MRICRTALESGKNDEINKFEASVMRGTDDNVSFIIITSF